MKSRAEVRTEVPLVAAGGMRRRLEMVGALLAEVPVQGHGPCLLWRDAGGAVRVHALTDGFRIGRARTCALRCDDARLSREHCLFRCDATTRWWVRDLDSTNDTIVNGQPVDEVELCDGDVLTLGATAYVFLR